MLTAELREAIGPDGPALPAEASANDLLAEATPTRGGMGSAARSVMPALVIIGGVLLVTGVIVSLTTDSLWALVVAAGAHAFVTVLVIAWALRRVASMEHMDPASAAGLEQEGIADPDGVLDALANDLAGHEPDQRRAVTPDRGRSVPIDDVGTAPEVFEWIILGVIAGASLLIALVVGGSGWLVPLIAVPLSVAWFAGQRALQRRTASAGGDGRARPWLGDLTPRVVLLLGAGTALAVGVFVLVLPLLLDGV